MSDTNRSLPELFGSLVTQLSTLFRKEVQLARAEVGEKVGQATGSVAYLAVGGVLLLALIILLEAVVAFLAYLGVPVPWARLIVGVVLALVGYGLVRSGLSGLKTSNLVPNRTVEQLSRDATVAKEQVQ